MTDPATLARALDGIRTEGYALVDREWEEGLRALAVPVRDRTGRAVAAVNAATHVAHRTVGTASSTSCPPSGRRPPASHPTSTPPPASPASPDLTTPHSHDRSSGTLTHVVLTAHGGCACGPACLRSSGDRAPLS
ncbi:IclR family transcriptional regulator C-terminal domain-containing protein [Streptomyces sp. NWU49]|uniref:IclR family transcriptional regulator domain-containing protein n=1 Tax=Streptomyces sp. NWU49 TaxID=2201153 RepID=UPI0035C159F2